MNQKACRRLALRCPERADRTPQTLGRSVSGHGRATDADLGTQTNVSERADSQMWNPRMRRIDCACVPVVFVSISPCAVGGRTPSHLTPRLRGRRSAASVGDLSFSFFNRLPNEVASVPVREAFGAGRSVSPGKASHLQILFAPRFWEVFLHAVCVSALPVGLCVSWTATAVTWVSPSAFSLTAFIAGACLSSAILSGPPLWCFHLGPLCSAIPD